MQGSRLELSWHGQLRPTRGVKVKISSSTLNAARLSGAVRLNATRISGKGFYLDAAGATRVNVDGMVGELLATMAGASRLDAEDLQVKSAELSISGAGKAEVWASDSLKVSISGRG